MEPGLFYGVMIALFVIALVGMWIFTQSGLGLSLQGTRDQPRRMGMLGHHVWLVRWIAFIIAGFWAGVAGIAFIGYHGYIHPLSLGLANSAEVLLMVISGGPGTLLGPIVGATLVVVIKTVVSGFIERWNFLLGAIFVAIVILMPEGIVPGSARLWRLITRKRAATPPAGTAETTATERTP